MKAAGRRQAVSEIRHQLGKLGTPIEADPRAVLLEQVYHAYGMQQSLAALLATYDVEDMTSDDPSTRIRLRSVANVYGFWSEKAAQFAALAIRAGIEERLVKLAESQAMTVVQVLRTAILRVELSAESERALLQAVAQEMRLINPGGSPDFAQTDG